MSEAPVVEQTVVQRVNILRGLAIAGVVAIHTSAHFPQVGGITPVVAASVVVDVFAHFAVPLFVMLSGFTLARRYGAGAGSLRLKTFYGRRLTKIIPPYLVFSVLYLLLFTAEYQAPAASWVAFALVTGSAYYHLWFVALLIQLYLLFPVVRVLLRIAGRRTGALLLAALLVQLAWNLGAPLLAAQLPQRPLFETLLSNRVFASHIFYFVIGMTAGLNHAGFDRRVRSKPAWPIAFVVAVLVVLTSVEWITAIRRYGSFEAVPPGAFSASVAAEPLLFVGTIVLAWQITSRLQATHSRLKEILAWLGILSLPIYLVHVFFQWLLARALEPAGLTPETWIFYVSMFSGTLLLSYLAATLFGRLPYSQYLTGVPETTR